MIKKILVLATLAILQSGMPAYSQTTTTTTTNTVPPLNNGPYDSRTLVDTNSTSNSNSTVTTNNNTNTTSTSTSTVNTNNTNNSNSTSTSTNTNHNIQSGTVTNINQNTNNGTMTYNNNNHNTGTVTYNNNNVNTGTMTYNNNNVSTSNSTSNNVNTNINTGDMTNRNINTTTSNNINNSTSSNTNVNIQQGEMTNRNINETIIRQKVEQPPPTAIAPPMMSVGTDLCITGISGAAQTQVLGVSVGSTMRDENCERLKLSKTMFDMGMKVAAVALMCQDERVFKAMEMAGTPCPYMGKIGKEASDAWSDSKKKQSDKKGFFVGWFGSEEKTKLQ